jgi:MFS family permease
VLGSGSRRRRRHGETAILETTSSDTGTTDRGASGPAGAGEPEGAAPGTRAPDVAIPTLIKRNTALLAAAQAFVGTGSQLVPTLGALMVERLTGATILAGLASSLLSVARLLIAYPVGWLTDTYGRRAGLLAGLVLSLVGAVAIGLAMVWLSFPLFLAGLLVFGLGIGAGQQLRTAAADMYPPARRAEGLGYVLTGSLVGALGGPLLINTAQGWAVAVGVDPMALAWLLVPAVLVPSMVFVLLIRPDPKEIAANLSRYYPSYVAPVGPVAPVVPVASDGRDSRVATGVETAGPETVGVHPWLAHPALRAGLLASAAAQGIMAMMMAMTPLVLAHHGHALPAISLAVALHVIGMFGFSLPLGRLADRFGRRVVMLAGLATISLGSLVVPITPAYAPVTLGLFLVGVGWSCVNVAVTALVADAFPAAARGRAVGVLDGTGAVASIVLPLAGGPLAQVAGHGSLAVLALALALVPVVLALRLVEPRPGQYGRPSPAGA